MEMNVKHNERNSKFEVFKGNEKVGFLNYTIDDEEIMLDLVKVEAKYRGLGIASMLVDTFVSEFRNDGRPLTLFAYSEEPEDGLSTDALCEFYSNHGFRIDDEEEGGFFMSAR